MSDESTGTVSGERLLGNELARAAEALLTGARPDPAYALQLATVQALLALYWEMRHRRPGLDDPSLEWLSALVCSGLPAAGRASP